MSNIAVDTSDLLEAVATIARTVAPSCGEDALRYGLTLVQRNLRDLEGSDLDPTTEAGRRHALSGVAWELAQLEAVRTGRESIERWDIVDGVLERWDIVDGVPVTRP